MEAILTIRVQRIEDMVGIVQGVEANWNDLPGKMYGPGFHLSRYVEIWSQDPAGFILPAFEIPSLGLMVNLAKSVEGGGPYLMEFFRMPNSPHKYEQLMDAISTGALDRAPWLVSDEKRGSILYRSGGPIT